MGVEPTPETSYIQLMLENNCGVLKIHCNSSSVIARLID